MVSAAIARLASEIKNCRICDSKRIPVSHTAITERGSGAFAFIVGIEPGNTEVSKGEPFSGLAGKRLMEWLTRAGLGSDRAAVLRQTYLTSLIKCHVSEKKYFSRAVKNCAPFLVRQLELVKPSVLITLGQEPIRFLFGSEAPLEALVGKALLEQELSSSLFPVLPVGTKVVPLPHPSPLSRWLNSNENKNRLDAAIGVLRKLYKGNS